jgi:hypothetical protein
MNQSTKKLSKGPAIDNKANSYPSLITHAHKNNAFQSISRQTPK